MAFSEFDPSFNPSGGGNALPGYMLDVGYDFPKSVNETQVSGVGGAFGSTGSVGGLASAFGSVFGIFSPSTPGDFPIYSGSGGGASPSALPTTTDFPAMAAGSNMLDRISAVLGAIGSGGDTMPAATNADYRTGRADLPMSYILLGVGALAAVWMLAKG